jgi:hypothetical protein
MTIVQRRVVFAAQNDTPVGEGNRRGRRARRHGRVESLGCRATHWTHGSNADAGARAVAAGFGCV